MDASGCKPVALPVPALCTIGPCGLPKTQQAVGYLYFHYLPGRKPARRMHSLSMWLETRGFWPMHGLCGSIILRRGTSARFTDWDGQERIFRTESSGGLWSRGAELGMGQHMTLELIADIEKPRRTELLEFSGPFKAGCYSQPSEPEQRRHVPVRSHTLQIGRMAHAGSFTLSRPGYNPDVRA